MNHRFLAVCLFTFTGCALIGILPAAVLAARHRDLLMFAVAVVAGLFVAAVLANAGADLWGATA